MPLEIGTKDSRCKACGNLIVGKESGDLGNPNKTVSGKWTWTQLSVPGQVAKVRLARQNEAAPRGLLCPAHAKRRSGGSALSLAATKRLQPVV
jgi:hypothetical protein